MPTGRHNPPPLELHSASHDFRVHGLETKFYGRRAELEVLYNAIRDAVNKRQAVVVSVTGAPGLGKTRLVHEFVSLIDIEARGITLLTTDSQEHEGDFSLRFTDQILRQRFAIGNAMAEGEVRERLVKGLGTIVEPAMVKDATMLLSHLLSLPMPEGSRPFISVPGGTFQQRALATFCNLLAFDASRRPVIIVVDGYQYAGQRTREVLGQVINLLSQTAVLIIVMSRQTGALDHLDGAEVRPIALDPLPPITAEKVLRHLLRRVHDMPENLSSGLIKRAKGNPHLLEDMVRLMLQRGILIDQGERWRLDAAKLQVARLPGTTGAVAKARIELLEERERRLLEMASVFGPVFWFGGVLALMRLERDAADDEKLTYWHNDKKESRLNATLLEMQGNDLVEFRSDSGLPDQVAFGFVNPIEQQRLYAGLPAARSKLLHRVAGQWIAGVASEESFQLQEIVGWHFEQAGDTRLAAQAYLKAARRAKDSYQNRRSADFYRRALEHLDVAVCAERCQAYGELTDLLVVLGEYSDARSVGMDMLYYSTICGNSRLGGQAYLRLGHVERATGAYERGMDLFERALKLFEARRDHEGIANALDDIGRLHWYQGEYGSYKKALTYFHKALSLRRKVADPAAIALSLNNIGNIHLGRGYTAEARESFTEALELRRQLGDRWGEALTLIGVGAVKHALGDDTGAVATWKQALKVAGEVGDRELCSILQNNLAEALLTLARLDEAEPLLESARATSLEIGDRRTFADSLRNKAELAARRGHLERALELANQAVDVAVSIHAKQVLGHALRTQGMVLGLVVDAVDGGFTVVDADKQASKAFQKSMAYFEEMGDILGLSRAMRQYGSYLMERGVVNKAKKLLARADEIRGN